MGPIPTFSADPKFAPELKPWPPFEKILSGKPDQRGHFAPEDETGLLTGLWECEVGRFNVDKFFSEAFEFSYILTGKLKITSAAGESAVYGPGESIITPFGFKGEWEVIEPVRKVFAIRKL